MLFPSDDADLSSIKNLKAEMANRKESPPQPPPLPPMSPSMALNGKALPGAAH
jgi:hypothetical protein